MIGWNYFKNKPNVRNLSEAEKRRRFLIEQERLYEQEHAKKMAAFLISMGGGIIETQIETEEDMALLAKALNIDLGAAGTDTLSFESGFTSSNSVPFLLVLEAANGTDVFDNVNAPAVPSTMTLTISSAGNPGDSLNVSTSPNYFGTAAYTTQPGDDAADFAAGLAAAINVLGNPIFTAVAVGNVITSTIPDGSNGVSWTLDPGLGAVTFIDGGPTAGGSVLVTAELNLAKNGVAMSYNPVQSLVAYMAGISYNANKIQVTVLPAGTLQNGALSLLKTLPLGQSFHVNAYVFGVKIP